MRARNTAAWTMAVAGGVPAWLTYRAYRREIGAAERRVAGGSELAQTRRGPIEYADDGDGFPLLVIHGAGGGFDQLLDFDRDSALRRLGFRRIFVSRFGYLRTPLPADGSPRAQAAAYAALLHTLGVKRCAVIAVSAGAPSALEFAAHHPDRCAALVLLVPAAYAPGAGVTAAPEAPRIMNAFCNLLLTSDFAFWLTAKLGRSMLVRTILGTPPEIAAQASPAEQHRITAILAGILPVRRRRAGLLNDTRMMARLQPANLSAIQAPTLVVSVNDDLYGTYRSARYIAGAVPHARLVMYPDGGHLWVGHDEGLRRELSDFLRPIAAAALRPAA